MSALADLAQYCGPTALASALGTTRTAVTTRLFIENEIDIDGATELEGISRLLGAEIHWQPQWFSGRRGMLRYPTVSQWLREHPVGSYVLLVYTGPSERHVLHVAEGEVAADSNHSSLRSRVLGYWPVRWGLPGEEHQ